MMHGASPPPYSMFDGAMLELWGAAMIEQREVKYQWEHNSQKNLAVGRAEDENMVHCGF